MNATRTLLILLLALAHLSPAQTVVETTWRLDDFGPDYDWLDDIAVDDSGFVYFCGTLEGGSMIAVGRLTPELELDWMIPSSFGSNFGYCVQLELDDSAVVVASNSGTTANSNAIVYRHDKHSGERRYAIYDNVRRTGDWITEMVLDRNDNVIIGGTSYYRSDSSESFIIKYDKNLVRQWGITYIDRVVTDWEFNDLAVDDSGNVFVTGKRTMKLSPDGALQWTQIAAKDVVVDSWGMPITVVDQSGHWMIDKYDDDGNEVWSIPYDDGSTMGSIVKMVIDDLDNIYICGTKRWPDTFWHTVKIDALGNTDWNANVTSPAGLKGYVYDIAVDRRHNVYVTGTFVDVPTDNFMSAVTVKYDPDGKEVWRQTDGIGNSRDEYGACLAVDDSLSVLVGGMRSQTEDRYSGDLLVWKYAQRDRFRAIPDGWAHLNWHDPMWQPVWWMQFDYSNPPYPPGWVSWPILAMPFDWPDWPVFVRAFGEGQCYLNPILGARVYNPIAIKIWRSIVRGSKYTDPQGILHHWKGSCYGFSLSSLLIYNGKTNLAAHFPGYDQTYNVPIGPESLNMIHSLQLYQWGKVQELLAKGNHRRTPGETIPDIEEMLNTKKKNNKILSIYNNNGPGAHAVVPCSLSSVTEGFYQLHIYDPNYPGTEQIIDIDTTVGIWSYDKMPAWGGSRGIALDRDIELASLRPLLPLPKSFAGLILFSTPDAATIIENPQGKRIGYLPDEGVLVDSIENAAPLIPMTGVASPPIGYALPEDAYEISVGSIHDSSYALTFISDSTVFAVTRAHCSESETDLVRVDSSLQRLRYRNRDAAAKTVTFEAISSLPGRAMTFRMEGVGFPIDDSLDLVPAGTNGIEIRNPGARKTYNLRLEYAFEPGYRIFEHAGLVLESTTAHAIRPDWEFMEEGDLPIFIDMDGDGQPDDTLMVANEAVTGVPHRGDGLVPDELILDQNYPNPFNGLTTIRYGLPERAHLRIKVFNILGQEVALLADGIHEAGFSSVRWDATGFSSGLYICRIEARGTRDPVRAYAKSIKLLLAK